MILVNDQNYDVNDAVTASIHVEVQVIDRNYDTNNIVTAYLAKSQAIYRISGHSPELQL